MKLTEAKQYESQGWPHIHIWAKEEWPFHSDLYNGIVKFKCRCGAAIIKRGKFTHIVK